MNKSKAPEVENVVIEIVDVTPQIAQELLEQNTHNRTPKEGAIEEYVNALKLGDWQFNGDPIRVASSGRLLDGQHRLAAIVEAGATVPIVLITGLTDHSQMTMDAGVRRSYIDHLKLRGEMNVTVLASAVRTFATYDQAYGKRMWPTGGTRFSLAQLDRTLEAHPNLREAAGVAKRMYDHGNLKISNAALATSFYVLDRIDRGDADFFWERAINGDGLAVEGPTQPILKLREFAANREKYDHQKAVVALGGIFKAWNAYRNGVEVATVAPRFGGAKPENFPWPK